MGWNDYTQPKTAKIHVVFESCYRVVSKLSPLMPTQEGFLYWGVHYPLNSKQRENQLP